jgi:PKD repeat protein
MARAFRTLALLSAVALAAGCSVQETPVPGLTGPSELALSLAVTATPDTIAQDGSSQTLVVVLARDTGGRAVANLSLRFDVVKDGNIVDFGGLSTKTAATGGDGRVQVVYTAPAPPKDSPTPTATPTTVSVLATPTGANYANAVARAVEIRLLPAGTVYDPATGPAASFTALPDPKGVGQPVVFNATTSSSPAGLVSYVWDFGDGSTGSGVIVQHTFTVAGTYSVRLTVTDKKGQTAWRTESVTVGGGPTASFTFRRESTWTYVEFDGSASWAVPPATIPSTGYLWTAEVQGSVCPGYQVVALDPRKLQCTYVPGRTYAVTLKVTDSKGLVGQLTQTITVQ